MVAALYGKWDKYFLKMIYVSKNEKYIEKKAKY